MSVHVLVSSTLRSYVPGYDPCNGLDVAVETHTPASLASQLGIPLNEIKFVMLNGHYQPLDTPLQDGDRLAIFPAVGGG